MKITVIDKPFPHLSIDNFIPSKAMVRAAAESFNSINDWVEYNGKESNQIQFCSRLGRTNVPPPALSLLDYIAMHFDPNKMFGDITTDAFPDTSHFGGGAMVTPNSNREGGYLGMHVDALSHGLHDNWKREYSVVLGLSEEHDSSFDLLLHDGDKSHTKVPYKFNRLWAFKCSENSWHGVSKITPGLDRKTLGVMHWSIDDSKHSASVKAKFNNNLSFD
jgi:hypothetical protein